MEHVSGHTIIGSCVPLARASSGGMHINSSTDPHRSPERHANTIGNAKCPCIGWSEGVGSSVIILDSSSQAVRSECVVSEIPASGRVDFHGPKAATGSLLPSAWDSVASSAVGSTISVTTGSCLGAVGKSALLTTVCGVTWSAVA